MTENSVEIASLVRQTVIDTLKTSAPGIAEQMRNTIANSVAMKVRAVLVPVPTESAVSSKHQPSKGE